MNAIAEDLQATKAAYTAVMDEFTTRQAHLIESHLDILAQGAKERELLLGIVDHWEQTRIRTLQPDDEPLRTTFLDLNTEWWVFNRNRVGDEVIPWQQRVWFSYHLLHNVYGVPMETLLTGMNKEKTQAFIEMLGTAEEIRDPQNPARAKQLSQEAALLRTYNDGFESFSQTYRAEIAQALAVRPTLTPGSVRHELFNAVLAVEYGFDPRERENRGKERLFGIFTKARHNFQEPVVVKTAVQEFIRGKGNEFS